MAWEVILVAAITCETTWSELANGIGLAVVGAGWDDIEEICESEAVVLLPEVVGEIPLGTDGWWWDAGA